MSRPFTFISSKLYYELEVYFFKLALYTDSEEYAALPSIKRNKIDCEINNMNVILLVMQTFRQIPSNEKAIMGKKKFIEDHETHNRLFRFSSAIVASKCLGINGSHITAVCRKQRPAAGGYVFYYEDDIEAYNQ